MKCGLAVVQQGESGRCVVLHREVSEAERVVARVLSLGSAHGVQTVLVGNATNGRALVRALRAALAPPIAVESVDEAFTSQRARARFHLENPPRGLLRLVPPGLRTPPRPYDDYVAVLLAEDYFNTPAR